MPAKAKDDEKKKRVTKTKKEIKNEVVKEADKKKKEPTKAKKTATTKKSTVAKKAASTKASTPAKKASATKKSTEEKKTTATKKSAEEKKTTTTKKSTAAKKVATTKKSSTAKKASTTKASTGTKKLATTKKTSTVKSTSRKTSSKKTTTKEEKVLSSVEYYDLPNNYNQTVVKVLFQTPKKLFVYWDISEADRAKLLEDHGKDFFYNSTPYLIVKNETKNYSFEIEINDFANSWYFDVPDSKCDYSVELIRKYNYGHDSIQIQTSNNVEVPNNHILFEQARREIFFINVKNNNVNSRNIANLQFIKHLGVARPITLNDFYNKFYDEQDIYIINNPSSY